MAMRITGMSTPARNSETGKHTGARATATHPLELVQSWQSLKPLTTLGLVHAGRLTVTRGMQGLLSAPCQTISATRAIPARCEKSTKTAERHAHLCADRCTLVRRQNQTSAPEESLRTTALKILVRPVASRHQSRAATAYRS